VDSAYSTLNDLKRNFTFKSLCLAEYKSAFCFSFSQGVSEKTDSLATVGNAELAKRQKQ